MTEIPAEFLDECVEIYKGRNLGPASSLPPAPTNPSPGSAGSPVVEDASPHSSPVILPTPLSDVEMRSYYYGLPSTPRLVARTGDVPWVRPTGPWEYPKPKELQAVGNHPLQDVWEFNLSPKFLRLLSSMGVQWTSVDVVRIGYVGESDAPVVIWIGARPESLSGFDSRDAALKCRDLLIEHGVLDVDVEIRESYAVRLGDPRYMSSALTKLDPTVELCRPFTTTLGTPIAGQSMALEGSSGFFILEGENNKRLLLVTSRHVLLGSGKDKNQPFEHKNRNQPRQNVTIFSETGFKQFVKSIKHEIAKKEAKIRDNEALIRDTEGLDTASAVRQRIAAQGAVEDVKWEMDSLYAFHQEVSSRWAPTASRIIGHVILSPPIAASVDNSEEGYTEDWAVVEVDRSKMDTTNFIGNVIDLGTSITRSEFTKVMNPQPSNPDYLEYPPGRLLKLRGIIPDDEMRRPTALDRNHKSCIMVLKRGRSTGLTIGRANNIVSFVRYLDDGGDGEVSKEWAIIPFNNNSTGKVFSAPGDSGSVIVDGRGRIGGLLTGGSGPSLTMDITYATPITFLLKRMSEAGLQNPHIYPTSTT